MVIELVERLDAAASELLACLKRGEASSEEMLGVLSLWKGRNTRKATESQFQALMALYGGCAGCGEPDENKVHAHHMDPFTCGGGTDLDNLMPLCWGCHAKIHDHNWQVVDAGDGKHTIRPPDRIHHGPARLPGTAPLFAPADPAHRTEPHPPAAPSRNGTGDGESSASGAGDGNRTGHSSRAGPTGPQAARAALRKARAALLQA